MQISGATSSPDSAEMSQLYYKLIYDSILTEDMMSQQPAAAGVTFKFLALALNVSSNVEAKVWILNLVKKNTFMICIRPKSSVMT